WKNEFIEFDLISLDKAFFILERYYNVSIDVNRNAIRHCMVRSRYENENLETVLIGLQLIFEFDYEFINDNKILIKNTRCST
ncbi:MAG: DUF4974 domain-containing protein, partial [Cytophagales bacterium]|nr:DUF4974 domain-containing protein [Cytophagales bacterium]